MAQEVNVEEAGKGRVRHLSEDQAAVEVQVVAEAAPMHQKVEQKIQVEMEEKTRQEVGAEAAKLKAKEESAQLNAENEAQPVAQIKSVAEAVRVETLISAIRDARTSDPKWRGAIHALETALEKLPQARAGLLPDISIGMNRQRNITDYATLNSLATSPPPDRHTEFFSGGFQVKLKQPLFNWDKLVGYRQAEYDVLAAEKQYEQDNQDFLLRVAQAYFDLAAAIEVHAAAVEHVASLGEQYRLTSKSYQIGIGNITELYEAEAKLELGKGDELSSKRQMELSRRKFRSIVGRDNYHLVLLKNNIKFSPPSPSDEYSWTSNAMANSPEILRKQAVLEKVRLEIEKRRAEYFPTVDGVMTKSKSYSDQTSYAREGFLESKRYIGVEATIPLFSGLSVVSKVREAESKKYEALEDVEYSRRTLGNDIAEAYGFVTDGLDELERYQKALEGSRKSEKANRLGYKIGIKSNLDVLNSQQQVFTDTRRVVKAKYDVIYYSLKLKALVGELDEAEFLETDHLFEKALSPSQDRNG